MTGLWAGKPEEDSRYCVAASARDFAQNGFSTILATKGTNLTFDYDSSEREKVIMKNVEAGIQCMSIRKVLRLFSGPKPRRLLSLTRA